MVLSYSDQAISLKPSYACSDSVRLDVRCELDNDHCKKIGAPTAALSSIVRCLCARIHEGAAFSAWWRSGAVAQLYVQKGKELPCNYLF